MVPWGCPVGHVHNTRKVVLCIGLLKDQIFNLDRVLSLDKILVDLQLYDQPILFWKQSLLLGQKADLNYE